jgi:hypothetical protein
VTYEPQVVERPGPRDVGQVGLRQGGLEVDVPHGRRLDRVGVAPLEQVEERQLREVAAAIVDRRVALGPVDRQADPPEQRLERLLVLRGDPVTQLDEALAPHDARRGRLALLIGERARLEREPRLVRQKCDGSVLGSTARKRGIRQQHRRPGPADNPPCAG